MLISKSNKDLVDSLSVRRGEKCEEAIIFQERAKVKSGRTSRPRGLLYDDGIEPQHYDSCQLLRESAAL